MIILHYYKAYIRQTLRKFRTRSLNVTAMVDKWTNFFFFLLRPLCVIFRDNRVCYSYCKTFRCILIKTICQIRQKVCYTIFKTFQMQRIRIFSKFFFFLNIRLLPLHNGHSGFYINSVKIRIFSFLFLRIITYTYFHTHTHIRRQTRLIILYNAHNLFSAQLLSHYMLSNER